MTYMLDTNAMIGLFKNSSAVLGRRVRECEPGQVCISSIVIHELYFGAYKSRRVQANLDVIDRLALEVLEFSREDARRAGRVRAEMARQGTPIGPYDVLIAGQAAQRGLVLVTRNGREFRRVEGLRSEDWESEIRT